MDRRTIVLLAQKRSGTSALMRAFSNHPHASIPHVDQTRHSWEPNFWNFARLALDGHPEKFESRLAQSCPSIDRTRVRTEEDVFETWDRMHAFGPVLFDKTPGLLRDRGGLDLLLRYRDSGRDVRFLGLIRDPRDVISSQFERWGKLVHDDSPERRAQAWTEAYEQLDRLRASLPIKMVRYEDLVESPQQLMAEIYRHCNLDHVPSAYIHLRPTNIGRHRTTADPHVAQWSPDGPMRLIMQRYNYLEDVMA